MLGLFTLALTVAVADPRPDLVGLQLDNQQRVELARVEQEIAQHPEESRRLGLDYLRGHLLDTLSRFGEASDAFVRALAANPALQPYSRYRLAYDHDRVGHPEVAAGLVAAVVAGDPRSPLIPEAVRLLARTLAEGGDCQLLSGLRTESLPDPQRREIELARGECALRSGYPELARSLLVGLLQEDTGDAPALRAAERLLRLVSEAEHGRVPMLMGITFQRHDEADRALPLLQRAAGKGDALSARETYETQLWSGLALLSGQRYAEASLAFARLATLAKTPADRALAFYQEARAHELRGAGAAADQKYQQAYLADPQGPSLAAPALLAALRIEWRAGSEAAALPLYGKLAANPKWRSEAARAALFLAVSDLVRGRGDRAGAWLAQARLGRNEDRLEADYWSGRLAELAGNPADAVARYLEVLKADPHHLLATSARARLTAEPLARIAAAEGRRLAASSHRDSVHAAWLLLAGDVTAQGSARRRLDQMLLADHAAAPYLRLAVVPVKRWPVWKGPLTRPEDLLLALGDWRQGAPAVRARFPLSNPSLAFTGALLLARSGEIAESIAMAERLRDRVPSHLPLELQPLEYRRLLYPFPYKETILAHRQLHGVEPALLAALLREESRFNPSLPSQAPRLGLTRLTLATARRLAPQLHLERLTPQNLEIPEVSIAFGAIYLSALLKDFGGAVVPALAGYQAGEPEAVVWRNQCFSQEPEELFSKIGTREARDYVLGVLAAYEQYVALYF